MIITIVFGMFETLEITKKKIFYAGGDFLSILCRNYVKSIAPILRSQIM